MRSRVLVSCVAALTSSLALTFVSQAHAADDGLTDSSQLSTPVIADGVIVDKTGTPVANNPLTLVAWPSNDAMNSVQQGDTLKLQAVAKAVTDSTGHFQLRLQAMSLLAPMTAHDGIVNLEIVAHTPTGFAAYNFGRTIMSDVRGSFLTDSTNAPAVGSLYQNLVAHVNMMVTASSTGDSTPTTDRYAQYSDAGCSATLVQDYGLEQNIVGQTTSATTYIDHQFDYTNGASSSLGVATSDGGSYGSYSTAGTHSKSSTSTVSFAVQGDNKSTRYISGWRFGKYRELCSYPTFYQFYQAMATSFAGGTWYAQTGLPGHNKCVPIGPLSGFTKDANTAYDFTTGFSVGGAIGINLETTTGYATNSKIYFHNRSTSVTRQLCGNNDYPGGKTSFVVATA